MLPFVNLSFGDLSGIDNTDVDQISFEKEVMFKDLDDSQIQFNPRKRKLSLSGSSLDDTLVNVSVTNNNSNIVCNSFCLKYLLKYE